MKISTVSLMAFLLVVSMSMAFSRQDSTEACTALTTEDPPFAGAYLALASHVATRTNHVYLSLVQRLSSLVISVAPQEPRVGDVVQTKLSGIWYSNCSPAVAHDAIVVQRRGNDFIYILAGVTDATDFCPLFPCRPGPSDPCRQRWTVQEELENLAPGTYEVIARVVDLGAPETVSTAHTWFTVSP